MSREALERDGFNLQRRQALVKSDTGQACKKRPQVIIVAGIPSLHQPVHIKQNVKLGRALSSTKSPNALCC